jgi:hypothetical protein
MTTAPATLTGSEANARAWAEEIAASHEAWLFCRDEGEGRHLSPEAKACLRFYCYDGTNRDVVADEIEESCQESALAVDVRSGWGTPGQLKPEEFQILLSTGGPALRIIGDLEDQSPAHPRLQHQDWGTPWIDCRRRELDYEALEWFCSLFYFGG